MYRVELHPKVQKRLKKIMRGDRTYAEKIAGEVSSLSKDPRPKGVEPLMENIYRIRVGEYRVIYSVFDKEKLVIVGKVDRRNESTYSPDALRALVKSTSHLIDRLFR